MDRMYTEDIGLAFAEMAVQQVNSLRELIQPKDGNISAILTGFIERELEIMKADEVVRAVLQLAMVKIEKLEIRGRADGGERLDKAELAKLLGPIFEAVGKSIRATVKASEAEMVDLIAGMERRITVLEERTTKRRK